MWVNAFLFCLYRFCPSWKEHVFCFKQNIAWNWNLHCKNNKNRAGCLFWLVILFYSFSIFHYIIWKNLLFTWRPCCVHLLSKCSPVYPYTSEYFSPHSFPRSTFHSGLLKWDLSLKCLISLLGILIGKHLTVLFSFLGVGGRGRESASHVLWAGWTGN